MNTPKSIISPDCSFKVSEKPLKFIYNVCVVNNCADMHVNEFLAQMVNVQIMKK